MDFSIISTDFDQNPRPRKRKRTMSVDEVEVPTVDNAFLHESTLAKCDLSAIEEVTESFHKILNVTTKKKIQWKKITILHRLKHYQLLCQAEKELKLKTGSVKYAFEYMKKHAGQFVKQGDLLAYCDKRRCEDTHGEKKNFKDNSRAIEILRKDKLPLRWTEVKKDGELWFKYTPWIKDTFTDEIHEKHKYKIDSFAKTIIQERLARAEYRCELTGIPVNTCKADADHFIPREKGGMSVIENCVILASPINTSKNKKMPVDWFCESILSNFLILTKRVGIQDEAKEKLIQFIQDY